MKSVRYGWRGDSLLPFLLLFSVLQPIKDSGGSAVPSGDHCGQSSMLRVFDLLIVAGIRGGGGGVWRDWSGWSCLCATRSLAYSQAGTRRSSSRSECLISSSLPTSLRQRPHLSALPPSLRPSPLLHVSAVALPSSRITFVLLRPSSSSLRALLMGRPLTPWPSPPCSYSARPSYTSCQSLAAHSSAAGGASSTDTNTDRERKKKHQQQLQTFLSAAAGRSDSS